MAKRATEKTENILEITRLETRRVRLCIRGVTPLIYNCMSEKARRELANPAGKKNQAARAATLKHNPPQEYRASVYAHQGDDYPTRLIFPAGGIKKAMMGGALEMPGATKAAIGRLTWIEGRDLDIYGVPQILMSITRSAGMNRTPDVRTRAILASWACRVTVTFVRPQLGETQVADLLSAAGMVMGLGDWRQEKGSGNYGQFELVSENDQQFCAVIKNGGREAQDRALADPSCYDLETEKMLAWWVEDSAGRREKIAKHPQSGNGSESIMRAQA